MFQLLQYRAGKLKDCPPSSGEQHWYCGQNYNTGAAAAGGNATLVIMMGGGMTHYNGAQYNVVAEYEAAGVHVKRFCTRIKRKRHWGFC